MKPNPASVVKVGDGRGFIIKHRFDRGPRSKSLPKKFRWHRFTEKRLVVTAAHCLPNLPPAHAWAFTKERSYRLLGTLDDSSKDVYAECLFVDPVADIAVLGEPDGQEPVYQAENYDALTADRPTLSIADAQSGRGWVLSIEGRWIRTQIEAGRALTIDPTVAGMSGSPILNNDAGRAVGIVIVGMSMNGKEERTGLQPILTHALPGWILEGSR
jgi:hypothetical protein